MLQLDSQERGFVALSHFPLLNFQSTVPRFRDPRVSWKVPEGQPRCEEAWASKLREAWHQRGCIAIAHGCKASALEYERRRLHRPSY